jgi:hypothetical protein
MTGITKYTLMNQKVKSTEHYEDGASHWQSVD